MAGTNMTSDERAQREKVLDQIAALLNLAGDEAATPGEAANALKAAQRLMLKHQIDEQEAVRRGEREALTYDKEDFDLGTSGFNHAFKMLLLDGVARHNFGRAIRRASTMHMWVIGTETARAAIKAMYTFIHAEIVRLATVGWEAQAKRERYAYGRVRTNAVAWKSDFAHGATQVVRERLEAFRREQEAEQTQQSMALVVLSEDELKRAVDQLFANTKLRGNKVAAGRVNEALAAGRRAGANIDLGLAKKLEGGR